MFVSHVGVILIAQHLTWKGDSRSFQNATVIFLIIVEGFYKKTIIFFTAKKKQYSNADWLSYPVFKILAETEKGILRWQNTLVLLSMRSQNS